MYPKILWIFGIICVFFGINACDQSPRRSDKLIIAGTSGDNPPFEFFNTEIGKLEGFSIDLMKAVAEKTGMNVEFKDMDFAGLIPAIQGGRIDIAIASMTPTEERLKSVDFTDFYYKTRVGILVKSDSSVKSSEDFVGKKIGVQLGSSFETTLKESNKDNRFQVVSLNKVPDIVQELKNNRIDIAFIDEKVAHAFSEKDKNFIAVPMDEFDISYAIAMKKESPYREDINKAIKELVKTGKIEELASKWVKLDR